VLCVARPSRVEAANGDCAQPLSAGATPTATDALFILNVAVGLGSCEPCVCDTDDSGSVTATDALKTLNGAVGVSVNLTCPTCEPVSLCDGLIQINTSGTTFDTPDIVTVVIMVSSIMISPVDPFVVLEPAVGSYTQSGAISGTINVVRVQ
jgi:hypothetical protein